MGFRTALDINAKCPLYEGVMRSQKCKIAGIRCEKIRSDLGFEASTIIQCGNFKETMDYKEIFCDDLYKECLYFKAWEKVQKY